MVQPLRVPAPYLVGDLAQQARPIELVIGRDYMQYWPRVVDRSRTAGDNLYLMKTPGQLLYGEADTGGELTG